MATLNHAKTADGQHRTVAITLAAILYGWFGLAFLVSSLLIGIYTLRNGALPVVFGIDMLAGPISQRFGPRATIAATVPWGVVNVLELVAASWLWRSRKRGGTLGVLLFPAGAIFWIGFALPIMVVVGPLRVLLLAAGWKGLR
jgi:hypothetical protein